MMISLFTETKLFQEESCADVLNKRDLQQQKSGASSQAVI